MPLYELLSFSNTRYSASALQLVTPFKCGMSLRLLKAHGGASCRHAVALLVVNNESVASADLGIGNKPSLRCGVQVCRCITLVTEGFTHYCEDDEENIPRSSSVQVLSILLAVFLVFVLSTVLSFL